MSNRTKAILATLGFVVGFLTFLYCMVFFTIYTGLTLIGIGVVLMIVALYKTIYLHFEDKQYFKDNSCDT